MSEYGFLASFIITLAYLVHDSSDCALAAGIDRDRFEALGPTASSKAL